jgi:hypothetical protein
LFCWNRSKSGSAVSLACRRPCTVLGSCSSESEPRSPFSPLSPFGLRNKVHQTSSNPLTTPPAYQAPRPFGAHSSTQAGPLNYQAGKANIPLPTPTHHSHKTPPLIKYVPTAVTITPPESSSQQQFIDFLSEPHPRPTSSLSSHVNFIVASILGKLSTVN